MPNYTSVAMLKERVGSSLFTQLAGADPGGSTLALMILNRAEGKVDGYLAARYKIPITPTNGLVEDISLTLAEWELYRRSDWGSIPEKLDEARKEAMEMLRELADSKLSLPDTAAMGNENDGDIEIFSDAGEYTEMGAYR